MFLRAEPREQKCEQVPSTSWHERLRIDILDERQSTDDCYKDVMNQAGRALLQGDPTEAHYSRSTCAPALACLGIRDRGTLASTSPSLVSAVGKDWVRKHLIAGWIVPQEFHLPHKMDLTNTGKPPPKRASILSSIT